jgi:hypothetical protein
MTGMKLSEVKIGSRRQNHKDLNIFGSSNFGVGRHERRNIRELQLTWRRGCCQLLHHPVYDLEYAEDMPENELAACIRCLSWAA